MGTLPGWEEGPIGMPPTGVPGPLPCPDPWGLPEPGPKKGLSVLERQCCDVGSSVGIWDPVPF